MGGFNHFSKIKEAQCSTIWAIGLLIWIRKMYFVSYFPSEAPTVTQLTRLHSLGAVTSKSILTAFKAI